MPFFVVDFDVVRVSSQVDGGGLGNSNNQTPRVPAPAVLLEHTLLLIGHHDDHAQIGVQDAEQNPPPLRGVDFFQRKTEK